MVCKKTMNEKALEAQLNFCRDNKCPVFIPSNGICWCCGEDIFGSKGLSEERAGSSLITGCPVCHVTYCD